ncbi:hypothetical protein GCM10011415_02440 [Salipiger pallidus]|uniref:Histidine kinase/HSP90-like ATPase domain-containing protein n=1 Tax=Salipiger pallidus TaxID=1775170 RepID=A0A8J3EEN7_9RHOB|nr:ATP-binding protein [Salipiger pallidus]GGG60020.1 hypothetical protein GCM10011415_02440 [Salipiger pallidus]
MNPPHLINFEDGIEDTLLFLKSIREKMGRKRSPSSNRVNWVKEIPNRLPRISTFYDFSKIESISVSAALVIASCYDRARRMSGITPPAINYGEWPQDVFQVLHDVGFFEFVGHVGVGSGIPVHIGGVSGRKVTSAVSGTNANGLEECSDRVLELLRFLSVDDEYAEQLLIDINSVVSEAMINVARHAYPKEFVENSEYDTIGQWWFAAQADRDKREIRVVVYDQGATIPGTLPQREWFKHAVETIMRSVVPDFDYDRDKAERIGTHDQHYINYSMKKGKTQTQDPQRGLGLPQMQSLIDLCDDGSISIVSRYGFYRYSKGTGITKSGLSTELEGTLVEWRLSLPAGVETNE